MSDGGSPHALVTEDGPVSRSRSTATSGNVIDDEMTDALRDAPRPAHRAGRPARAC